MLTTILHLTLNATVILGLVPMSLSRASAQENASPRVCTSPDYINFTFRYASRLGQSSPRGSAAEDWRNAFLKAVQQCQRGDALVISREAMDLAARFCDLDKPLAFKSGGEDAALCTYAGSERERR